MSKHSKVSGLKWHQTPSGPRPCTATKKACPYSTHFETEEDAFDTRKRGVVANDKNAYNLPFNVVISVGDEVAVENGDIDIITSSNSSVNLREMSDYAQSVYVRTGVRPRLTTGVMTIDLKDGRRLVIQREVFGVAERPSSRYHLTYWSNPNQYEIRSVILDEKEAQDSYEQLQAAIQQFMEEANQDVERNIHDEAVRAGKDAAYEEIQKKQYSEHLREAYEKTIQTLDQIEILSRGSQKVNDFYSIDLFSKNSADTLSLRADCGQSVFQPEDVVESLKIHAMQDDGPKKIELHVSEELPNNEGAWALARIPEGNWFFSYAMDKETFTHEISAQDANEAGDVVAEVLRTKHMPKEMVASRSNFVKAMIVEVEPAIQNYYHTMEARKGEPVKRKPPQETSMKDKLFGIFS